MVKAKKEGEQEKIYPSIKYLVPFIISKDALLH
jgi:hypothetical protein